MAGGEDRRATYAHAARRMAWPVIASTGTTLAVFAPLLFWSGMVGEFMKFLPITVIFTLSALLLMALVLIPVLGGVLGRPSNGSGRRLAAIRAAETGRLDEIGGMAGAYVRLPGWLVRRPGTVLLAAIGLLVTSVWAYGNYGRGVEFPEVEPELAQVQVKSRDNLSIWEKDALVRRVEERVFGVEGIDHVYSRTIGGFSGATGLGQDVIGVVALDFAEWDDDGVWRRTST